MVPEMTTWVLLRGLMRESRHWGEFPQLFRHAIGAQQIVTLDFPGNGKLFRQASATSVQEMARYCHTQLTQLGYAPPYNVLALSLGAMVAEAWSELYPDDLERLVLINTSLAPYSPFYQRLRPQNYPALTLLLYGSATQRESLILRLTSTRSQTENLQVILQQWVAYAGECPISAMNVLRQLRAAISYRAALTTPNVPVLLLGGQQDQLVNVKCTLTLAQHWHCATRLHPTAGHDLPLDDGVWVASQVREWLAMV
jgi:pimeloyl-ACP methyl ester carboxylesterase